jgi:hypothetical protein
VSQQNIYNMTFKTELSKSTLVLLIKTIEKQSDNSFIDHTLEWCAANEISVDELISSFGQMNNPRFKVGSSYSSGDDNECNVRILDYNPRRISAKYLVCITNGDRSPVETWTSCSDIDGLLAIN